MKKLIALCAVILLLVVGMPVAAAPVDGTRPITHYTYWNAHREDIGGQAMGDTIYTGTQTTCEAAIETTLIEAYRDGWQIDDLNPSWRAVVAAFPVLSPCSATLAVH